MKSAEEILVELAQQINDLEESAKAHEAILGYESAAQFYCVRLHLLKLRDWIKAE